MIIEYNIEYVRWEITHIIQAGGQLIGQFNLLVYSPTAIRKSISLSENAKASSCEEACLWWDLKKQ